MIPLDYITAHREWAPWPEDSQVEQDLIICRALIDIYSVPELAGALAFRGGTALYKLHLKPASRYSEDIDLVQVAPGAIGHLIDIMRSKLDSWLGKPKRLFGEGRVTLIYRMTSERQNLPMKLKIEINSREHFSVLGLQNQEFFLSSNWFEGSSMVKTYALNELLGTKLRALYQRKKGRDLFDLWIAQKSPAIDFDQIVKCFGIYMKNEGHGVNQADFLANIEQKIADHGFLHDIKPLLAPWVKWDIDEAVNSVKENLLTRIPR